MLNSIGDPERTEQRDGFHWTEMGTALDSPRARAGDRDSLNVPPHPCSVAFAAGDECLSESRIPVFDLFKPAVADERLEDLILAAKQILGDLTCPVHLEKLSVSVPEHGSNGSTVLGWLKGLACSQGQKSRTILDSITTTFSPGRICLVAGAPQCGKSTLLRAIAGRLPKACKTTGKVNIGGRALNELPPGYVRQVVGYVPPTDEHVAVLTVEETLNFAYECTMSSFAEEMAQKYHVSTDPRATRPKVLLLLKLLGLTDCRQTKIGDSRVRGLSGGEKKRVTLAEQMVRTFPVCLMDEISTGLDAKLALDIVRAFKIEAQLLNTTRIISLLQPPPSVYNLFDEILLLGTGGLLLYHGPLSEALNYFREFGFRCPPAVDLLDFLAEICNDGACKYYHASATAPIEPRPPLDQACSPASTSAAVAIGTVAGLPRATRAHAPTCADLARHWMARTGSSNAIPTATAAMPPQPLPPTTAGACSFESLVAHAAPTLGTEQGTAQTRAKPVTEAAAAGVCI